MFEHKVVEREHAEFDLDMEHWQSEKPFGISGCFRLRNEAQFMKRAILSFLPYLDEAVLVVQPSDDDTVEIANEMAQEYEKVKVYHYPFVPYPIDTHEHFTEPENSVHHFVHLSNWALTKCKYSWICKVEGDVIALSSMNTIRNYVEQHRTDKAYLGLVLLNLAGRECNKISATNPMNFGWDEAIFNNDPMWHFVRHMKWESINHWEHSELNKCMGWALLHTKRCKEKYADGWNNEVYLPFTRENVRAVVRGWNMRHPYPADDDPFGADCLFEQTCITEAQ